MAMSLAIPPDLLELHKRYIEDDPALTEDQINDMRMRTNSVTWRNVLEHREARRRRNVTPIAAGRSEADIAKELREDLQSRLEEIGEIITKARREHGFVIAFQFAPADGFGRCTLATLEI